MMERASGRNAHAEASYPRLTPPVYGAATISRRNAHAEASNPRLRLPHRLTPDAQMPPPR